MFKAECNDAALVELGRVCLITFLVEEGVMRRGLLCPRAPELADPRADEAGTLSA